MRRRSYSRPLTYKERQEKKLSLAAADIRAKEAETETNPDTLHEYAHDSWSHVRLAAADNLNTYPDTIAGLTYDYREEVSYAAYRNINCPETALLRGARRKNITSDCLVAIASHRNRTPTIMEHLSHHRGRTVAIVVASDSFTPEHIVRRYLNWKDPAVVAAALSNVNLTGVEEIVHTVPPKVLYALFQGVLISGWGMKNFRLADTLLSSLMNILLSLDADTADALICHQDGNGQINEVLLQHPAATFGLLKISIAKSRNTFPSTLLALTMDSDRKVRDCARLNPNCPDEGRVAGFLLDGMLI